MSQPLQHFSAARILMVGYYGKGNFGDDVLLSVSYNLLQRALPDAETSIIIDGENGEYVRGMLDGVTLLTPGRHGHFDLIVHGGGGVFFDFRHYGWIDRMRERAFTLPGLRALLAAETFARKLAGKPRISATSRLGLGIGVGTFSPGSPRLRSALAILADFDALWLRDTQSPEHLKRFASIMRADIIHGSDLAFLTQHWLAVPPAPRIRAPRPRLGIILRDWPEESGSISAAVLEKTLAQLTQIYDITGFIFDATGDQRMQQLLAPYTIHCWQPQSMSIADFSTHLAAQDVLLTSRAHGAICGACLGVASVIVNIEPKLEQVHAMLPHASIIVQPHEAQHWETALALACAIDPATIAADVAKNRESSEAALLSIKRWLA